jgi:hypothetical protein
MAAERLSRAISIQQPFAEAILRGLKRFEFRTVPTVIRERVYVYASLRKREDDYAMRIWRRLGRSPGSLPTGKIVGSIEIIDCRPDAASGFAYKLSRPRRVRKTVRFRNQPLPLFWRPRA